MVKWIVDKSKEKSRTKIMYPQDCAEREEENTELFSFITWSTEQIFNYKLYTHYYCGQHSDWTERWWWWR